MAAVLNMKKLDLAEIRRAAGEGAMTGARS
jgi:hypothetical protein